MGEAAYPRLLTGRGIIDYVVATGQPVKIDDFPNQLAIVEYCAVLEEEQLRTALVVPVQTRGRVYGVLVVGRRRVAPFDETGYTLLLSFANHAAVVWENFLFYQEVQHLSVLEERERLARELHDGIAQTVGLLNVKLALLDKLTAGMLPDKAQHELCEIKRVLQELYVDVREEITDLKRFGDGRNFIAVLGEYLNDFQTQTDITVAFTVDPETLVNLSPDKSVQVLRVVQEALHNVRRHARADKVMVDCGGEGDAVILTITDNGRGFEYPPAGRCQDGHFGLAIMRERIEAVGGMFQLWTRPGAGTRITIKIPAG